MSKLKNIEKLIEKPIKLMELPDELATIQATRPEQPQGDAKRKPNRRWGKKKPKQQNTGN